MDTPTDRRDQHIEALELIHRFTQYFIRRTHHVIDLQKGPDGVWAVPMPDGAGAVTVA